MEPQCARSIWLVKLFSTVRPPTAAIRHLLALGVAEGLGEILRLPVLWVVSRKTIVFQPPLFEVVLLVDRQLWPSCVFQTSGGLPPNSYGDTSSNYTTSDYSPTINSPLGESNTLLCEAICEAWSPPMGLTTFPPSFLFWPFAGAVRITFI